MIRRTNNGPMGPRMFIMLKRGLAFVAGRITPADKHENGVLEIKLDVPGNPTKIRLGYDGSSVILAVIEDGEVTCTHQILSSQHADFK